LNVLVPFIKIRVDIAKKNTIFGNLKRKIIAFIPIFFLIRWQNITLPEHKGNPEITKRDK
jgi:hypothetical protein